MTRLFAARRERDRWLAALCVCALLFALSFACCRLIYETNDDSVIVAAASGAITGAPYAGNGFTSYLYGAFLAGLFTLCNTIPWHALFLLAVLFLSTAAILKTALTVAHEHNVPVWVAYGLFLALYVGVLLPYVVMLQFTTVAAMASAAGCCLLLGFRSLPKGAARRFAACLGALLLLCGFALRIETLWVSMPLLIGFAFAGWACSRAKGKPTLLLCLCVLLVFGALTLTDGALYRATEAGWEEKTALFEPLGELLDYHNVAELDHLAPQTVGWSPWLTFMVRNWYQLDARVTAEQINAILASLAENTPATTPVSVARATGSVLLRYPMFALVLLGFGLLWLLAFWRYARAKQPWRCLVLIGAGVYLLLFIAYFYGVLGRLPARAAFAAACPCYVLMTLACIPAFAPKAAQAVQKHRFALAPAIGLALALCCCAVSLVQNGEQLLPLRHKEQTRDGGRSFARIMCEYAVAHPEYVYVTDGVLDFEPFFVYGGDLPSNLIEWSHGLYHTAMYQEKLRLLGFEDFNTLSLLEDRVYLLVSNSYAKDHIVEYISSDYFPVTAQALELTEGFDVYKLHAE